MIVSFLNEGLPDWRAFVFSAGLGLASPDRCAHVGSLSTAFWPFENAAARIPKHGFANFPSFNSQQNAYLAHGLKGIRL
jgi:hypothetical protein